MKTFSYYLSTIEEVEVGNIYYFGQLVEGDGDLDENEDDHKIVDFEIVEEDTDILKTKVKVIDIF